MRAKVFLLGAASAGALAIASAACAAPPDASSQTTVGEIVVTARRLDTARDTIQPQTGASTYAITNQAIQAMPAGDNAGLNQVVLQAPGVAQDSYGQLHIRGEHNGVQYRINGVILPEGLSVFGQALSPRLADRVTLITGALPAQYGLRTAGIVDVTTKEGDVAPGGHIGILFGSRDYYDVWLPNLSPSMELMAKGKAVVEQRDWDSFARSFRAEINGGDSGKVLDLLVSLSKTTNFSIGCYCENENRCHRAILRQLLDERGASIA